MVKILAGLLMQNIGFEMKLFAINRWMFTLILGLTLWSKSHMANTADAANINSIGKGTTSLSSSTSSSSSSTFIPSSPLSTNNVRQILTAIKVNPAGQMYNTQILKQQLANELNLPLRDLRVVDPSFPTQIQATFTARPKAILFCIENIKVIVQADEALIFSPNRAEVQEFIPILILIPNLKHLKI